MEILNITKSVKPPRARPMAQTKIIYSFNLLKFTTMKKTILILFMALFAFGFQQAFAQITLTPTPLDPDCIDLRTR